jgi:hypothetical protein
MSDNKLTFVGMLEFRKAMHELPSRLRAEATAINVSEASAAMNTIAAGYPVKTRTLKAGLRLEQQSNPYGSSVKIRNLALHSALYEYGSEMRYTDEGAKRGKMPARPLFIPTAIRHRRRAVSRIVDKLRSEGFTITGSE